MSATFRAMNTEVAVVAPGLPEAAERRLARRIARVFEASEQRFSRFRAESELSALNCAAGPTIVSPELFEALLRARRYVELTGGLFDPTVGAALRAAGYDRSFTPGQLDRAEPPRGRVERASFARVVLDEATRSVTLPSGVYLDFGGFIKGWTVDQASALLPPVSALDAGGDAVLRGLGPEGDGWLVDVEDPFQPGRGLVTLRAPGCAVATSAPNRRRWRAGAVEQHHLIDPRTGRPAATDVAQATVLAPTAEQADVLAKAAFLLGARAGQRWLERFAGVGGVFVLPDGGVRFVGQLEVACAA
ncbi:MAG: FAD:protein FMN transferase [Chloroflexi bacterium]|nr:FAD:protein FMN transferase [Chloroflexota bacterium]